MTIINIQDMHFSYPLDNSFSLSIDTLITKNNCRLIIDGPSGCGKTTFLNLITGLLKPNKGQINVLNTPIHTLSASQCDQFRADHFGIIFQQFNLIPYLTIIDNIILPCTFSKKRTQNVLTRSSSCKEEARRLCEELDIHDYLLQKPISHLSIGQQQRVAIARALIGQPDIIIADEPTSALDNERKDQFMTLLLDECNKYNTNLIFVSHDTSLKSKFDQTYSLNKASKTISMETHHVTH